MATCDPEPVYSERDREVYALGFSLGILAALLDLLVTHKADDVAVALIDQAAQTLTEELAKYGGLPSNPVELED